MKRKSYLSISVLVFLIMAVMAVGTSDGNIFFLDTREVSVSSVSHKTQQQQFTAYLEELFSQEITQNTIDLHYTLKSPQNYGITSYPVTYGEISEKAHKENLSSLENIKNNLETFQKDSLSLQQKITYDILKKEVETELEMSDFYYYQELLRPSTGIQAELPVLLAEYRFSNQRDIEDYLKLLNQLPEYFQQVLIFEMEKANQGLFMSEYAAEDIIHQCKNFIKEKEKNYLLDTFSDKVKALQEEKKQNHTDARLSDQQIENYITQNHTLVMEKVIPAYEMLIQGMEKLKKAGKNQYGLCYFPKGKEYYGCLVKAYTGSEKSPQEMMEAVEKQRQKDLSEAETLMTENTELMTETATYTIPGNPEHILLELQEKMKQDFPDPPDTNFSIKSVHPSLEEHMAPAFYLSVPIDDISNNNIYINQSSNYQKLKLYTTLAHEGFPGHLYQNVMERSQNFPAIRSLLGTSGYSEGWATYVEMISYDYIEMEKPVAQLLQKDQSALLSLYATADLGIHWEGWTLQEMKSFFQKYHITDSRALEEIFHLIVEEPGHYLKYYIGYLEFLQLKEYAKSLYQKGYEDYNFHQALMEMGPAQFSVLKEYLPEFYGNISGN